MLRVRWLGRVDYQEARDLQQRLFESSQDDHLLLMEHQHVFTGGPNTDLSNLLIDPSTVGATYESTNRGGDITYHGPGQAVLYPVIKLSDFKLGVRDFVTLLEEAAIRWLNQRDIAAARDQVNPGVWVGTNKIAAIGIHVRRDVTTHGMAMNVRTDLGVFDRFIPCGLAFHGVDRVVDHMNEDTPTEQEVALGVAQELASLLNTSLSVG